MFVPFNMDKLGRQCSLRGIGKQGDAVMQSQYTEEKTLSVPEAGKRYFGLSPRTSYERAKTGELPGVMRIGGLLRVSVPVLEQTLRDAGKKASPRAMAEALVTVRTP